MYLVVFEKIGWKCIAIDIQQWLHNHDDIVKLLLVVLRNLRNFELFCSLHNDGGGV